MSEVPLDMDTKLDPFLRFIPGMFEVSIDIGGALQGCLVYRGTSLIKTLTPPRNTVGA